MRLVAGKAKHPYGRGWADEVEMVCIAPENCMYWRFIAAD